MSRTVPLPTPASPSPAATTLAYVRCSKEEQARPDKTSLAHQRTRITERAAQLGRAIEFVFEDAGFSGGTAHRPAFQALVAFCEAHSQPTATPGLVLVYNDSRWGRFPNPEEAAYWRVHLDQRGWKVRYAEGDDSDDLTVSSLLRALHGSQATVYREQIRQNSRQGRRGTAERGFWYGTAPIGYRRLATCQRTGATRVLEAGQQNATTERTTLTPGPDGEVELVRWLFEAYGSGTTSLGKLAAQARERWPARDWSRSTLQALLRNPAYVGEIAGCRRTVDTARTGRFVRRRPEDWIRTPNAHPALIECATFDRVQALLARNQKATSPTTGGYPLSGLIVCAHCGTPYIGGGGRRGPVDDPDRYRFYREATIERRVECNGPVGTVVKRHLEPLVVDTVARVVASPAVAARIAEELDRVLGGAGDERDGRGRALEQRRSRVTAKRDRLLALVAEGLCTEAEARTVLAECRREIDETTAELERLRFQERRDDGLVAERDRLLALATDFAAQARQLSGTALRELLRPWLYSAVIDKRNRTLVLEIRRIPASGVGIGLSNGPGRD